MPDPFEAAVEQVTQLRREPGNDVKLVLYGLYKQATLGDVQGRRPGGFDLVGKAKYDAWATLAGTGSQDARDRYVAEVQRLVAADG